MSEAKFVVIAKDGCARIGNDFHELEDNSSLEFNTESISDLSEYVKGRFEKFEIYFDDNSIEVMPRTASDSSEIVRNIKPYAICSLIKTSFFNKLNSVLGSEMNIVDFERFLTMFRGRAGVSGKMLLDNIRDFRIHKAVKIERKKDSAGNIAFGYQREKGGADDFEPPTELLFTIPIFKHIKDEATFKFDFTFDFKEIGDSVNLIFRIDNLNWSDDTSSAVDNIILNALKQIDAPKYRGSLNVLERDDSWRFKSNAIRM